MKLKKIEPNLWVILVGYLILMAGIYLRTDLPGFLGVFGIVTMALGALSWIGNLLEVSGSDEGEHTYNPETKRGWIQMKFRKINPHFWIVLVGYLIVMAGVYLKKDLPGFLGALGLFTLLLGVGSSMRNISGFSGSSSDGDTHK